MYYRFTISLLITVNLQSVELNVIVYSRGKLRPYCQFLVTFRISQHGKPDMLVKMKCKEFHQHFENSADYFWIWEIMRKRQ